MAKELQDALQQMCGTEKWRANPVDALNRKTLADLLSEMAKISILRLPAVKARVGLGRSSIYARIADKEFPAPISLGGRAVGWLEHEIQGWIDARVLAARSGK